MIMFQNQGLSFHDSFVSLASGKVISCAWHLIAAVNGFEFIILFWSLCCDFRIVIFFILFNSASSLLRGTLSAHVKELRLTFKLSIISFTILPVLPCTLFCTCRLDQIVYFQLHVGPGFGHLIVGFDILGLDYGRDREMLRLDVSVVTNTVTPHCQINGCGRITVRCRPLAPECRYGIIVDLTPGLILIHLVKSEFCCRIGLCFLLSSSAFTGCGGGWWLFVGGFVPGSIFVDSQANSLGDRPSIGFEATAFFPSGAIAFFRLAFVS
mmetsp:Transcript_9480/g.21520  ORF Transcript_9480/g.21520 Transcript_9480/m.21520 type:complete len:267 (-) Transcript_9480:409-1209(-)